MPEQQARTKTLHRVILDPGHGGADTGYQTEWIDEKEVNMALCFELRNLLQAAGVEVLLTRDTDLELSAAERAALANESQAHLYIGWHCDDLSDRGVSGVSLWVHPDRADLTRMTDFERIGERICDATGQIFLGVFQEREDVLGMIDIPALEIRGAFLSNPNERELCTRQDFLRRQAHGALQGILRVLSRMGD
ncbi:MAG TPA: N-acetylmuramoyl-L-alanine amidase [Bacilli bacterium]|nr:N-acetylmuramoyl-L-alanine amidase [Bacilli bacterium]